MELAPVNKVYGHAEIIRRYAGLPRWLPLPFAVQHGWFSRPLTNHAAELSSGLSSIWAWSETSAAAFRRDGNTVFVAGAPFLYASASVRGKEARERRGTIVFPPHGSRDVTLHGDFERYLADLEALPADFHPLTFCLHPHALDGPLHRLLLSRSRKVVSNGPVGADDYLARFIRNAEGCRYATSNLLSTALIYAAHLGVLSFLLGPEFQFTNVSDPHDARGRIDVPRDERSVRLSNVFSLSSMDFEAQRRACREELGSTVSAQEIKDRVRSSFAAFRPHRWLQATGWRLQSRARLRYATKVKT